MWCTTCRTTPRAQWTRGRHRLAHQARLARLGRRDHKDHLDRQASSTLPWAPAARPPSGSRGGQRGRAFPRRRYGRRRASLRWRRPAPAAAPRRGARAPSRAGPVRSNRRGCPGKRPGGRTFASSRRGRAPGAPRQNVGGDVGHSHRRGEEAPNNTTDHTQPHARDARYVRSPCANARAHGPERATDGRDHA